MENKRLDTLKSFLEANPSDCFVRYGLAQEYLKLGDFSQAIDQFQQIFTLNPDYQAAYYHAGKTYEKLGRKDEARDAYTRGIEASERTGDLHARGELEAALAEMI